MKKINQKVMVKNTVYILLGILSASFGLEGFLIPNNFIDGGVTGISMLFSLITGVPVSLLLVLINLPFVFIGYKQISKTFAIKTFFAIVLLSVAILFVRFPVMTQDKLLIAIFGGFFLGSGIGLSIRGGCVIDGTEIIAVYLSRKGFFTIGNVILLFNIIIFSFAAYVINIESALYSILTFISASKTVDFIVNGIEEYVGVTIVSEYSEGIRKTIINEMKRGVTIYKGERGFKQDVNKDYNIDIIFTVVTRLELPRLKNLVTEVDKNAFITQTSLADIQGGFVKRRSLH